MDTNNTNNMESKELLQSGLETLRAKQGFICDMDGVIYHGNRLLPGVKEFVDWLYRENKHFLFLTNSSERSPKELRQKLLRQGAQRPPTKRRWRPSTRSSVLIRKSALTLIRILALTVRSWNSSS